MGYVVIDLEFNNLGSGNKKSLPENKGLENEIIEIGAVKLDRNLKVLEKLRVYVKPMISKDISPIIKKITKIDMDILFKHGISFNEAMDKLKKLFEDGDVLCSWAKDDLVEIINNCRYHNYQDINWINCYLDIQEYVSRILGHKKVISLKSALDELMIKVNEKKLHDALNDSIYTCDVFKRMYNSKIVEKYIVKDIYNMPAILVKKYENINFKADELKLKCPRCRSRVRLESPIKFLRWRYVGVGRCMKCNNNILCEIIVKKTLRGEYVYQEINSILKDNMYESYLQKIVSSSQA